MYTDYLKLDWIAQQVMRRMDWTNIVECAEEPDVPMLQEEEDDTAVDQLQYSLKGVRNMIRLILQLDQEFTGVLTAEERLEEWLREIFRTS